MISTQRITAVFAAPDLRPVAQMAFVASGTKAPAASTGPEGPDGHLANTTNVIRYVVCSTG